MRSSLGHEGLGDGGELQHKEGRSTRLKGGPTQIGTRRSSQRRLGKSGQALNYLTSCHQSGFD